MNLTVLNTEASVEYNVVASAFRTIVPFNLTAAGLTVRISVRFLQSIKDCSECVCLREVNG